MNLDLRKEEMDKKVESLAPELLDLRKCALLELEKASLETHKANVALVLDISGSMSRHYRSGLMQEVTEKVLALATILDDDGEIDVFFFGSSAYFVGKCTLENYKTFLEEKLDLYGLEGSTYYANAVDLVRRYYYDDTLPEKYKQGSVLTEKKRGFLRRKVMKLTKTPYNVLKTFKKTDSANLPDKTTFVIFQTDGEAMDPKLAGEGFVASTFEPIFWFKVGLGEGPFKFLEAVDEGLPGGKTDNASLTTTTAEHIREVDDNWIYQEIAKEYAAYPETAVKLGLIKK